MDAQTVYVKDWDVQLIFKGRSVPENVKAIGIRAHDLIPVYGTISGAMLKVKEWKSVDYPFERKYFIQCESGCEDFCWFVQREILPLWKKRNAGCTRISGRKSAVP